MLVTCWSVKGGSGTTTVACALALVAARSPAGALLVDLAGEAPAVLGLPEPSGPGVVDWLAAGADVPVEALGPLEQVPVPGLALLPTGGTGPRRDVPPAPARVEALAAHLATDPRLVVVDGGLVGGARPEATALAAFAGRSLLVLRPCYLALRRAVEAPVRPSAVVVVGERGRHLDAPAMVDALGVPVAAALAAHPQVAAAVDAGLLARPLPARLTRPLVGLVA